MLVLSPTMEAYEKSLLDELHREIAIAKEARKKGLDPTLDVEIPIASDLADRVEVLIGIKGVAVRIRELEAEMSREEAALRIGDDFVARKFGEKDIDEVLDHSIRTAMALLTEGCRMPHPRKGSPRSRLARTMTAASTWRSITPGPSGVPGVRRRPCPCSWATTCARNWGSTVISRGRMRSSGTSRRSGSTTPS